jgi:mono/diheme cytochrome c family protein
MPERLEIPEEYADLVNPLTDEKTAVSEGRILFESNCASCHGVNGEGDGPAAAGLEPPPQNLSQIQADLSDAYLFWRVSDGGLMEPFNSVMPAWRGILSEDHIWQIILFLRTL